MLVEETIAIIHVYLSKGRIKVKNDATSFGKLLAKGNSYMYIHGK